MTLQIFRQSMALSGLCAALVLAVPTSATAGTIVASTDNTSTVNAGGHVRASGSFSPDGEVFRVTDKYSDGFAVFITYVAEGNSSVCINTGGTGTMRTCDLSFAEGARVSWRVCYGHSATWWDPITCGSTMHSTA